MFVPDVVLAVAIRCLSGGVWAVAAHEPCDGACSSHCGIGASEHLREGGAITYKRQTFHLRCGGDMSFQNFGALQHVNVEVAWKSLARHGGRFAFLVKEGLGCTVYALHWVGGNTRRATDSGIIGTVEVDDMYPAAGLLPKASTFRVHGCRNKPCTAMWSAHKYGAQPPPLAHGEVLGFWDDASPCDLQALWEAHCSSLEAAIVLSSGAHVLEDNTSAAAESRDITSAMAESLPSLPLPPLPPPEYPRQDVEAQMLTHASKLRRPGMFIGVFDCVVFAALHCRSIWMRYGDNRINVLAEYVPNLVGSSWELEPFPMEFIWCKRAVSPNNHVSLEDISADIPLSQANHFLIGVPFGCVAASQYLRDGGVEVSNDFAERWAYRGLAIVETVCDGNCGIDAMCLASGRPRDLESRIKLRHALCDFMRSHAADVDWQRCFAMLGEVVERPAPTPSDNLLGGGAGNHLGGGLIPELRRWLRICGDDSKPPRRWSQEYRQTTRDPASILEAKEDSSRTVGSEIALVPCRRTHAVAHVCGRSRASQFGEHGISRAHFRSSGIWAGLEHGEGQRERQRQT